MKFGALMFATAYSMRPDEFAVACEERGFESVWFPEHTHIPASRRSPGPGGAELTKEYWHNYDLFVAMSCAATATRSIKVASGICLAVERDPIVMANAVASIDRLSGGRVIFGIGGGWNAEEMENHGVPFDRRWKVLREKIEAMKEIWTNEEAEYHGEFVDFDPIWSHPKPVQQPHPPILLGTWTGGLHRVVRYCDGWMPVQGMHPDLPSAIEDLHERAEQAGRELTVTVVGAPTDQDGLGRLQQLGVERGVFAVPSSGADRVLPVLDAYAEVIPKFA